VREVHFRGKILTLVTLERHWEVVEHAAAVAVLAREGKRVLGIRQWRPAVGLTTWELPAGIIDPGETPEEAAARELAEEGRVRGDLQEITSFYSSPGFTDERIHLFEASNLSPAYAPRDPGELLEISWKEPAVLWEEVRSGRLATSSTTLVGILHALTPPS